jgi:hypothetical protein
MELALHPGELVDRLDHVHRDPDRPRLIGDRAGDRLPDPPGRVRRELVAAGVVELLDRPDQPQVPLLDQVEEDQAAPDVALRDRHHQPQIGLDQPLLAAGAVGRQPLEVAAVGVRQRVDRVQLLLGVQAGLDRLGQLDLVFGRQQRHPADLPQVDPDEVAGAGPARGVRVAVRQQLGLRFLLNRCVKHLDAFVGEHAHYPVECVGC